MKMCLDCGKVAEMEGDTHRLCPTPSKSGPAVLVDVRVEDCPLRGVDKRTKRYRDNPRCDSEHHHYGRGDHVVILDAAAYERTVEDDGSVPMTEPCPVYLAARYSRREELCGYRSDLEALGFTVTSRWLNGNHQVDEQGLSTEAGRAERERFAREDYEDVRAADLVIAFTEQPRQTNSRGGRHVELGIAIGLGTPILIVGPRENVFCCLEPEVNVCPSWENARVALGVAGSILNGPPPMASVYGNTKDER